VFHKLNHADISIIVIIEFLMYIVCLKLSSLNTHYYRVATTREMCFALAGEHKRLKDRLEVGKSFLVDTQQKSSQQTLAVKVRNELIYYA